MKFRVKTGFGVAVILACGLAAAGPRLRAQAPAGGGSQNSNQNKPPANAPAPAATPSQNNANSFPKDESSVPVLPSKDTPDVPPGSFDGSVNGRAVLPAGDVDPVESPDDSAAAGGSDSVSGSGSSSSSSLSGIDSLEPGPDDEQPGKHGRKRDQIEPQHQETAAEDENVGKYYLDSKNWRAALSRFQSAMVLDPDNPDVYWGLAESERHVGSFADARTNYLKVMEYDPGSKHAKEAKKALEEPEIANAKQPAAAPPATKRTQ